MDSVFVNKNNRKYILVNQKIKKVAFIGMGLINSSLARDLKIKKFIYTSTVAIYGNNSKKGIDENSKPNPESLYGISKLSGLII